MTTGKKVKPVCERCQSKDWEGQEATPVGDSYAIWDVEQQRMVIDDDSGAPYRWHCPICEDEVEVEWVEA